MSRFVEKLKRASSGLNPPIGFGVGSRDSDFPSVLLVADITSAINKRVKDLLNAGVDSFLINIKKQEKGELNKFIKSINQIPVGFYFDDEEFDSSIINEDWYDFIIFGLKTNPDISNKENIGRILAISDNINPARVKGVNGLGLGIDGVLIRGENKIIDIDMLLACHLFSDLLNKPLLININNIVSSSVISELVLAGVRGLVIAPEVSIDAINEMKNIITSLPKPMKRKHRDTVIIPDISSTASTSVQKVEEDDEEDI